MNVNTALIQEIKRHIAEQDGLLSFADFMQLALYHPELGYYNSSRFSIGTHGDFTTAPEISPLFAQCIANQLIPLLMQSHMNHILEIGAGSGQFAKDLLEALAKQHVFPHYFIHEISPALQKQQKNLLQIEALTPTSITWLDKLPSHFSGIIIANEVLDALPVHCFYVGENNIIKERCVTWKDNQFSWQLVQPITSELIKNITHLQEQYQLPADYASEFNLHLPIFLQTVCDALTQGMILFIDYGYGQSEYYHPQRQQGTLTCFYQQQMTSNPFLHVGLQDITAHVDFTRVAECASEYECALYGFTTQAAFLLDCGLLELAHKEEMQKNTREQFHRHQAIKRLTMPNEMGDVIKVMALQKEITLSLPGFRLLDRRRDL